jgi:hypothetical protein
MSSLKKNLSNEMRRNILIDLTVKDLLINGKNKFVYDEKKAIFLNHYYFS